MKRCPLEHQCQRSPRQLTSEYGEGLYFNEGLEFAILCMEMGRFVIAEVHSNHNPKESSYLGHSFLILPSPAYARPIPGSAEALRSSSCSDICRIGSTRPKTAWRNPYLIAAMLIVNGVFIWIAK